MGNELKLCFKIMTFSSNVFDTSRWYDHPVNTETGQDDEIPLHKHTKANDDVRCFSNGIFKNVLYNFCHLKDLSCRGCISKGFYEIERNLDNFNFKNARLNAT